MDCIFIMLPVGLILCRMGGKRKSEEMLFPRCGSAYGNRTRVPCVRGMCPSR